ncbi:penicillin-binding protein 2 [Lyngbya sp. PCC 8106]|uniref:peptidoglycan D,D-transpeptidase FtsI family protein n=1 Tax=Lyngbya sp. (strain PCC 8106) TaxID=313612 RepID=UPI0000EAAD2A|nr:penicillin-binding protein [Lyngbya sp. PCC 8106]
MDFPSRSRLNRPRFSRSIQTKKPVNSSSRFSGLDPRKPQKPVARKPAQIKRCKSSRLRMVWLILLGGLFGLLVNLFRLQIMMGPMLKQQAQFQQSQRDLPFVPRRPISDMNGHILAIDQIVYTLYAHPKLFQQLPAEIAEKLSKVLVLNDLKNPTANELLEQFQEADSGIKIAESISEEVGNHIASLRIDGLELIQQRKRLYPQQNIASDIVGYVDSEGKGQAGVEHSQQELLERVMPSLEFQRSVNGNWVPTQLASGFIQLDDLELRLTIDTRLQRMARKILKENVEKNEAKRGTVVVMDARNGEILTLVNEPSYDPNEYWKSNVENFKNWALSDLYEPGSTFKPINVAIALEAGGIQQDTMVYDEGRIQMGRWTIQNADYNSVGTRGSVNITDVIKYSSNIGMVHIMQQIEPEVFYDGLKRLGLGELSGVDLPFEVASTLKTRHQFMNVPVESATAAFGQGLSITPLKLAQLNATLANGGKLVTPHVVKGLYNSKGQLYWETSLPESRQVFSSKTANKVLEMMESVVTAEDGTGKAARIAGYRVAGKTGTAQKASATGGYSENARITSFVGILTVNNPRYVVIAVIDEPQIPGASGGRVAAPIVKSVMEGLIGLQKIPPSDLNAKPESELESEE